MLNSRRIIFFPLLVFLYSCATTPQLTQQEINQQYPALAELGMKIETARSNQVDIMAPQGYQKAVSLYEQANAAASKKQSQAAMSATEEGLATLQVAQENADLSGDIFDEVIIARQKAKRAGAAQIFDEQLSSLDSQLMTAASMVEQGKLEQAKRQRPDLRQAYSDLELNSLKQSTVSKAEAALNQAQANDADTLAPKTYAQAQEELRLAESILEADRTDTDRANVHAERATILSKRSNNIAELVKDFDRRDFSREDIVLWYQNNLATVGSPLGVRLDFDRPNDKTVNDLHVKVSQVVTKNQMNEQRVDDITDKLVEHSFLYNQQVTQLKQNHSQEVAALNQKFTTELAEQELSKAEIAAMEIARENRFNRIQDMFDKNEAMVYRQKDNVLVSVHGFDFPPGKAEIEPKNFGLMDKVVKSIKEFDGAKVVVSGHTDITGSADRNKTLSQQRADNVAKFLAEVGGIPKKRIVAEGYGQTKPVASNETPEGRAQNRRVEVLIVNE